MKRVRRSLLAAGAALLLTAATLSGATAAPEPTADELAKAAADRALFGLSADTSAIRLMMTTGLDVGTEHLGIPMTVEEEKALDLPGRMAFADAVINRVLPTVQRLPTYGGSYFDQPTGGGFVVLLTERDIAIESMIAGMMPQPNLGLSLRHVRFTYRALESAWRKAWDVWESIVPNVKLLRVRIDAVANRVVFVLEQKDIAAAAPFASAITAAFDVEIAIEPGEPDYDAACTSRDNCRDPMMAGIKIYHYVTTGATIPDCTMGFHIAIGVDEHFVTAGHCSYQDTRGWYHPAFGSTKIGNDLGTLLREGGQDIEYVSMQDAQRSDDIYRPGLQYASDDIISMTSPSVGMAVQSSRGRSNDLVTGTVTAINVSWRTSNGNFLVTGGDTSLENQTGDSGSPLYHIASGSQARAIGVLDTAGGLFARLDTSLDDWGAVVFLN